MNPELQRNFYLEFSNARLIGMPAFLAVIFSLTYLMDGDTLGKITAFVAMALFIVIVLFWGTKQVTESVFEELRSNTWDIQRTSAISPWSLAWGKLLGSTLFTWYGGLLCLLVYGLSESSSETVVLTLIFNIIAGILCQSLSLLVSFFSFQYKPNINSSFSAIFSLLLLVYIIPLMFDVKEDFYESILWFGTHYNQAYFISISLIVASMWAMTGIYRLLSEELQIRSTPWVWVLFVCSVIIYLTGMINIDAQLAEQGFWLNLMRVGFVLCMMMSYLLLFINQNSPLQLRKLYLYGNQKQWLKVWQEVPCWLVCVFMALPFMLVLSFIGPVDKIAQFSLYPVVLYLLMIRDVTLVLYFSYAENPKWAISLTLLSMISLYGLLPAIFNSMGAKMIAGFVFPLIINHAFFAGAIVSAQVVVVTFLLYQRWQLRVVSD